MDNNQVLIEYLGNRSMSESDINILKGYANKISFICKFNKDKLKTLLNKLSETFFYDSFDKNIIAYNRINDRVDEYFSRQKNTNYDYKKIISIIKYQYIVSSKYTKLLGILTKENKDISETHIDISNIYKTSKSKEYIKRISKEYINNIKSKGDKQPEQNDGNEEFKMLEKIVITILRKSLFTHSYLICYGSYTNHIIHNVNYEDIDVYFPDSFFYLILIMFSVKMISGLNLNILGYPFIKGHLALLYGDKKLIDCIYLNVYTLDKIRITEINGIKFIDPLFQFLNQVRMNNELFRCNKIFQDPEKYEGVLYSFLIYIKDRYKSFDLKKIREYRNSNKIGNINYKMYGNNICLINIDKFIKFKCDGFDKLIIILSEPQVITTELDNIYGVYSIKYNAFLNEIFFETRENKGGFKNKSNKTIDRKVFETHTFSDIIDYNKRYLIMSNLTNTLYIDVSKKKISIRNIQSLLATLSLYAFLKKKNDYGWKIFNYLISTLIYPVEEDFENYGHLTRYRKENLPKHTVLNIESNVFNDFKTDKSQITVDYLDKDDFKKTYGLNGGF